METNEKPNSLEDARKFYYDNKPTNDIFQTRFPLVVNCMLEISKIIRKDNDLQFSAMSNETILINLKILDLLLTINQDSINIDKLKTYIKNIPASSERAMLSLLTQKAEAQQKIQEITNDEKIRSPVGTPHLHPKHNKNKQLLARRNASDESSEEVKKSLKNFLETLRIHNNKSPLPKTTLNELLEIEKDLNR